MKIGIIREGKVPPDSRVPLTPRQCAAAMQKFSVEIVVESSPIRCYTDEEFWKEGITVTKNLDDCDVLLGVKEVPVSQLIPGKTYFFFSHTIKKQAYNRNLLWSILEKNIRLIDYEVLKDETGNRVIAFGRFAGMVGAHNALWTYGKRTGTFSMPRMKDFHDYGEARDFYLTVNFPPIKIVLTGTGRVGTGAVCVLRDMGIRKVKPADFLQKNFDEAVFTQLDSRYYVSRKDGGPFEKRDFYSHPERYKSAFAPFYRQADVMINGIFWDARSPAFFTMEEMTRPDFKIHVIADVTCDIAPNTSIPTTVRASTIADPVFGFDPETRQETPPFQPDSIDMMTIDNLPNEMPRDASESFGHQFFTQILPELMKKNSPMLDRATIARDGVLTRPFSYLHDYVAAVSEETTVA